MIANAIVQEEILAAVYDEFRDSLNLEAAYLLPCRGSNACQVLLDTASSSHKANLN